MICGSSKCGFKLHGNLGAADPPHERHDSAPPRPPLPLLLQRTQPQILRAKHNASEELWFILACRGSSNFILTSC